MQLSDLNFEYPPELIATEPSRPSRVAFVAGRAAPEELSIDDLLTRFTPGDVLVINETEVIPVRVFSQNEIEILFLKEVEPNLWEVLFPAREFSAGSTFDLPAGARVTLEKKGLPQLVRASHPLTLAYFQEHGEFALPPYIQARRTLRHHREEDRLWYQTAWAKTPGSVAAPTASLHFQNEHLQKLKARGVHIARLTLHVGAGTFLPVRTENLGDHTMHAEEIAIPAATAQTIESARAAGKKIWALGTTVTRPLESMARGLLTRAPDGSFRGDSRLFIYPPYDFKIVDALLTNFHQPKSTLLALVCAFASGGLEQTRQVYEWAIARRFKLFSYGDLSVWTK